ncbi:hypothetical protein [Rhizobium bangladeshense]|uniref:hypothetical protein n=1 Tax=Rhizobium bangladeshense TaxID=1138189 RepID=UPI000ACC64F6|nr:hypothetical protein [Rhizobium bangladeshense]
MTFIIEIHVHGQRNFQFCIHRFEFSRASTSSSSPSDDLSSLEAQLAQKQAALSQTYDEREKATIEKSIETLEAKIAKIEATERQGPGTGLVEARCRSSWGNLRRERTHRHEEFR